MSIALVTGLSFAMTALLLSVAPLSGKIAGARDFVIYWATGQQLVHHANPYDQAAMTRIERAAGLPQPYSVGFMRNPPWGLPLTMPVGIFSLRVATVLWSLVLIGCLAISVHLLWVMHGRRKDYLQWLGYSFAPAMVCLIAGQTALFALLGLVLFLYLHRTRPFLAGMSLWLCALKPHLFLAFGVVLLAWIVVERSYKVLAGAVVALAASCALIYWISATAWHDYLEMMRTSGIEKEMIPCLSIVLRLWVSPQSMWLQYLPSGIGCCWALVYFWQRRRTWDWMKDGSLVMLVSLVSAPYCWLFDQCVAIPALLEGAYLTRSKILLISIALASVAIEVCFIGGIRFASVFNLWTAPAWLAAYLIACAFANKQETVQEPA
jgi:hypothetical protein